MIMQTIKHFIFTAIVFMALTACDKDSSLTEPFPIDDSALPSYAILVENANQKYLSVEVGMGSIDGAFFVPNDGLIDEYTASERDFVSADKQNGNSFVACLRSTELEQEQRQRVRRLMLNYQQRNERIIANHRMLVRQLHERMQTARRTLYLQYRNDHITEDELRARLAAMREHYQDGLQRIRTSNAEAFSRSYAFLLERLQDVLTEEQWEVLAACLDS